MALLDDVAAALIAANVASSSGAGAGWYLTRGTMPDSTALPDRMVALLKTGGEAPLPTLDVERPTFRVLVRGAPMSQASSAYIEARRTAEDARDALHFLVGTTLNSVAYPGIVATEEVSYLGEDGNQRPVFGVAFRAWRQE